MKKFPVSTAEPLFYQVAMWASTPNTTLAVGEAVSRLKLDNYFLNQLLLADLSKNNLTKVKFIILQIQFRSSRRICHSSSGITDFSTSDP
jgi:hypothetical protein